MRYDVLDDLGSCCHTSFATLLDISLNDVGCWCFDVRVDITAEEPIHTSKHDYAHISIANETHSIIF